jgi:hypothetical protein
MRTNLLFLFFILLLHNSCKQNDMSGGTEYILSGKIYNDCSKSKVYANTPLEVVYEKKPASTVLATTTTGADGSFSLTFRVSGNAQIVLQIPANDAIQLYSPINLLQFFPDEGYDDGKLRSITNTDFYLSALTDVKVRLQCGRTYTNQDTLYMADPRGGTTVHKIIAPQNGATIDFNGGNPRFKQTGINYGIGLAEYQKSLKSGGSYPQVDYNVLRFRFPTCDKSPMEIVLNLP